MRVDCLFFKEGLCFKPSRLEEATKELGTEVIAIPCDNCIIKNSNELKIITSNS